ncbi:LRCH1 protein, partial [Polypterus senegalus]
MLPWYKTIPSPRRSFHVKSVCPDVFPCRAPRAKPRLHLLDVVRDHPRFISLPEFTLNDFLADNISHPIFETSDPQEMFFSRHNYQKLIKLFTAELLNSSQAAVNIKELSSDSIPAVPLRIPERQILYGLDLSFETLTLLPHCNASAICLVFCLHSFTTSSASYGSSTAHFISSVPDLKPLAQTLIYLNLSFNDLNCFPTEVYNIRYLEVLKLRDNPIKDIPAGISKLSRLRTFIISFCLLETLPSELFLLSYLSFLDVSYNMISILPHNISNLRFLEFLNVEGNELGALPCGALKLQLKQLRISNNYMHHYFWEEYSKNQPQRLCDLAAMMLSKSKNYSSSKLPSDIKQILSNRNQLSALPVCLCGLPLKVLIASNNKLCTLPEELGQLKDLMELDISCNEITALPQQIGQLRSLRELNIRRNYIKVLPEDLAHLPLVKFDFSCNKVEVIPLCFRKMTNLQILQLDNNPLQSPPAQICIKGKVHIFKYLSIEACRLDKTAESSYLPVIESMPQHAAGSTEDIDQNKKQDTDSGVGSDNGDKRLSATEPSDEDTISLNAPMTNITEEEGVSKDVHLQDSDHLGLSLNENNNSEESIQSNYEYGECTLSTPFVNYMKARSSDFDEPLRIDEDQCWITNQITPNSANSQEIPIEMINQLREAVELLQDPNRENSQCSFLQPLLVAPVVSSRAVKENSNVHNSLLAFGVPPCFREGSTWRCGDIGRDERPAIHHGTFLPEKNYNSEWPTPRGKSFSKRTFRSSLD